MKIYIVSFQSKENNETIRIHISPGREQWRQCGYRGRRGPERAEVSCGPAGSVCDFLWGFQPSLSSAGVQGLSQSVPSEPVWEGAVLSVSSFAQQEKKKTPKTNKQKNPTKTNTRLPGAQACGFPREPGAAADRPAPSSHSHAPPSTPLPPPAPPSSPLPSPGLYPSCLSAHWRYQKFQMFKAVSAYSVYMLGFFNDSWPDKVQHLPHL